MSKYAFGIDIGGTTVKMGLFSADGEMIESWEIPTRKEENGAYILPDIAKSMEAKMEERGFKKDEISLTLDNGYLIVGAAKTVNEDEKDSKGKMLRQERFSGAMQRSFYVGDAIQETDVKAKFEDGVLRLTFPKEKEPEIPEKKTIMIEG